MYQKELDEPLTFYECIQLLNLCVKNSLIMQDEKDKNNILVYRSAGKFLPEGWYTQNLMSAATELAEDVKGQNLLRTTLLEKGIAIQFENNPFLENSPKEARKIIERD